MTDIEIPLGERGTLPLFTDALPVGTPKRAGGSGLRSVAFAPCPKCTKVRVGLVRMGKHLLWRAHTYTTWAGTARPCVASDVAVCTLPPKVRHSRLAARAGTTSAGRPEVDGGDAA